MLRLGGIVDRSTANGPGVRTVVWVQGCARHCPGCFNPDMHDEDGGVLWRVEDLAERIAAADVEGVTFSGGEPFEQADAAGRLADLVKRAGLSVICYTGEAYEHLASSEEPAVRKLLSSCDVLIDGPFLQDEALGSSMRGSANQRVVLLSSRYTLAQIDAVPSTEVAFSGGHAVASGVAHSDVLSKVRERLLEAHGIRL